MRPLIVDKIIGLLALPRTMQSRLGIEALIEESKGEPGPQGPQGEQGPPGQDGNTLLSGVGDPYPSLGTDGDFYINITAMTIFGPKSSGAWGSGTLMIGGL